MNAIEYLENWVTSPDGTCATPPDIQYIIDKINEIIEYTNIPIY